MDKQDVIPLNINPFHRKRKKYCSWYLNWTMLWTQQKSGM